MEHTGTKIEKLELICAFRLCLHIIGSFVCVILICQLKDIVVNGCHYGLSNAEKHMQD